jgi:hypothetical protein
MLMEVPDFLPILRISLHASVNLFDGPRPSKNLVALCESTDSSVVNELPCKEHVNTELRLRHERIMCTITQDLSCN